MYYNIWSVKNCNSKFVNFDGEVFCRQSILRAWLIFFFTTIIKMLYKKLLSVIQIRCQEIANIQDCVHNPRC
jgi:hypothetical protein